MFLPIFKKISFLALTLAALNSYGQQNLQDVTELGNITNRNIFLLGNNNGIRFQYDIGNSFWVSTPGISLMSIGGNGPVAPASGAINILFGGNVGLGITNPANQLSLPNNKYIGWQSPDGTGEHVALKTNASNDLTVYAGAPDRLYIQSTTGNVGIGTAAPQSTLSVAGTVTAKRIKVTTTGWADFVFKPGYQLPSLPEVADYIAAHKHLEGIPSEEEVQQNGVDLGEINKQLLQKVEELTLYLIQQQKEIEELKTERKKKR
ncbi:hypothetical protein ACDQ55_05495 [Chitinophaga sp. 30R24]|uniref:hypothetical protein n=1 Tax=Chitinophaga sp. 30R24 TaxID=3248838 RepID=UPI003B90D0AC